MSDTEPSSPRFPGRHTGTGRRQFPRNDVGRRMTRARPNTRPAEPAGRAAAQPSLSRERRCDGGAARAGLSAGDRTQRGYRLLEAGRNRDWRKTGVARLLTAGLDVQPAPLHGVAHQVRPAREAELLQRPGLVGLHRLRAEVQLGRDLLVAEALRDQPDHLRLTLAQLVLPPRTPARSLAGEDHEDVAR